MNIVVTYSILLEVDPFVKGELLRNLIEAEGDFKALDALNKAG